MVVVLLLMALSSLRAQQLSESYYRENYSWIDPEWWADESNPYLLRETAGKAPFEEFAIYGLSFIDYDYRGSSRFGRASLLGVLPIDNPLERYGNFNLSSMLRSLPHSHTYSFYNSPNHTTSHLSAETFDPSPSTLPSKSTLRVGLSSRTYNLSTSYSLVAHPSEQFSLSVALGGRAGRDLAIEGLFSERAHLWLAGEWRSGEKDGYEQSLTVAFVVAPELRSGRSWNTQEVFDLAGDPHYNSYWGIQNGKVRSSRVTRTALPTLYGEWNLRDNIILTDLNISALISGGRHSRTSLEWDGAPSPSPDYYAYLPSSFADPRVAAEVEGVWAARNLSYTQIDWHRLHHINSLSDSGSHYALMSEREDRFSAVGELSGTLLGARRVRVGVRGGWYDSHNYNTPADLLGGSRLGDGVETYNYRVGDWRWGIFSTFRLRSAEGELSGDVELGSEGMSYESLGAKPRLGDESHTTFRGRVAWSRGVGDGHLGLVAHYHHTAPYWESLFAAPEGRMSRNPYADGVDWVGGELNGDYTIGPLQLHATLYGDYEWGGATTELFWDGLSSTYASIMAGGLEQLGLGAELSAQVEPLEGVSLEGHLSLAHRFYTDSALADIISYDDGLIIAEGSDLDLAGLSSSVAPRFIGALAAKYFSPSGWLFGVEWAVAMGRTMEPSLLFASDYLLSANLTPEERSALTQSVELGSASNLDVFLFRRFGRLGISLSVGNLLNDTEGYSGGYRSSRVKVTSNDHTLRLLPYAPRYRHLYPRHLYLTLNYEF